MCSVMCLHCTYLKLKCWLFFRQIETDSEFLRTQQIMDYSLLLGVHYRAPQRLRTRASYRRSMAANRLTVVSEVGKDAPDTFHKMFLPTITVAHLHECKEKTHELMFDMWSISTLCAQLEPGVAKLLTIFSWFFCLEFRKNQSYVGILCVVLNCLDFQIMFWVWQPQVIFELYLLKCTIFSDCCYWSATPLLLL